MRKVPPEVVLRLINHGVRYAIRFRAVVRIPKYKVHLDVHSAPSPDA